jgi:deoxyribose-phosphate aldolase
VYTLQEVVQSIDHTLLKPAATEEDYRRLCREAIEYGFKAVCVLPFYVPFCVEQLRNTTVAVATVIGFPLGANASMVKAYEAEKAFRDGAAEADVVMQLGALKGQRYDDVLVDLQQVVNIARAFQERKLVKVIIETGLLTVEEKKIACQLAVKAGADFVKTSTGFNGGGATVEDVSLMAEIIGDQAWVKASGGIRTWEQAEKLLQAGASRLGTSSGVQIVQEFVSYSNLDYN